MNAVLRKTGRIALKVCIGFIAFLFFVIYVVIPVGVPWAIRSQGAKILKHPVQVRSVWFNPFLLRLSVNGLKILEKDKKSVMAGFDRFWVNVSLVSLFKKVYRIESTGIDGLVVNAVLLPDNSINLMNLVPSQSQPTAEQAQQSSPQPQPEQTPPVAEEPAVVSAQPQSAAEQSAAAPEQTQVSAEQPGTAGRSQAAPEQPAAGQSAPPSAPQSAPAAAVSTPAAPASASGSKPLPKVAVDKVTLTNGTVTFTDQAIAPGFKATLSAMDLLVTGISTMPDSTVDLVFKSKLDDKGRIETRARVKPFVQPLEMEAVFSLNDYAMRALTPYVGKYTGHAVKEGGHLNVKVDYRIADNKLVAAHKVLIQKFDFGEKVESKDALSLPFSLALAILEDPQDRINISLPVHGDISDPEFEYFHLLVQVAKNFFIKLVTAPFKMLLAVVPSGGETSEEMGTISFAPGSAVLDDENRQKVDILVKAMNDRPRISLEINGSYDTAVDWKEMKTQAYENKFRAKLAESSLGEMRVYEDMYKAAFGFRGYWGLVREFTRDKKLDEEALKAEVRRRIIESGAPDNEALQALAQSRAQAVYDAILAAGLDPARVTMGLIRTTQASMDTVPLEFTLTVKEGDAPQGETLLKDPAPEKTSNAP